VTGVTHNCRGNALQYIALYCHSSLIQRVNMLWFFKDMESAMKREKVNYKYSMPKVKCVGNMI